MSHALVVGKFYPPHVGHVRLIQTAIDECDRVTVAACHSSVENIPIEDRIAWLYDEFGRPSGTFEIVPVFDDTPVEYTDETWGWFLDALMDALDRGPFPRYPDTIYSGERYAPEFAERLNARYAARALPERVACRMLDRSWLPISATAIRANPPVHWDDLLPAARAGLAKRVVICGAESSGTTTLAKQLAQHYDTSWAFEYGRYFTKSLSPNHRWTPDDFRHIAQEQKRIEDNLARRTSCGLLICDTDEYATAMFSRMYLTDSAEVEAELIGLADQSPADLYIITDDQGVEFEQDGFRLNEHRRSEMTDWFRRYIPGAHLVTGDKKSRLYQTMLLVDCLLEEGWNISDPIEYQTL
jgi:HTH-type transcriptional repressor of NAD biosynthesis genes